MTLEYIREGQGPALLLLHGVGGDAGNWSAVAARLRDRFTLIAPDLRGHGRSEPIRGPVDVHDLARDVGAVLDVAGIECCGVAGFSLGGVVAQALALDFPERVARLAVIGTVCGRTADEQARARERVDFLARNGVAAIAEANRARWFTDAFQAAHPDVVQARVDQVRRSDPESYLRAYTVFATADFAERVHEIAAPMLVVTGEDDIAATPRMARLMQARARAAELHLLAGLRHSVLIEAPAEVAALLRAFFGHGGRGHAGAAGLEPAQ